MSNEARAERQEIDPVFKQLIEDEFDEYQSTCQTEYEVNRLPRTIDAFITVEDEAERQKIHAATPFFYLLKDSQLEFKGRNDRLTKDGYAMIRGRMEFLLSEKNISPSMTTVSIICAGKPRAVFTYAKKERKQPFVAMGEKGYYKTDEQPPIYVIVINELPIIPRNYPLLVFASNQRKFRAFLEQMIAEGKRTYIRYAYEVRPQVTKEVLTMAGLTSALSREDLEFMADDIGRDLVGVMNPKDVLEGMDSEKQRMLISLLNPNEILADMSLENRLQLVRNSIEELLKGIGLEKLWGEMDSENRKMLFESLLKMQASDATNEEDDNGNDGAQ